MNGNDVAGLSYKELQALALRYRVPGNIKKDLLIKVLRAAERGDGSEVGRLLAELKQTRKKRPRKMKHEKINCTSTPIDSPEFIDTDDRNRLQQQLPYHWVGAEEEIVSREDDSADMPAYEEFRQFLLHRIEQQYEIYDPNNNSSIMDTSMGDPGTNLEPVGLHSIGLNTNHSKLNVTDGNCNFPDHMQPTVQEPIEYQTTNDSNGNIQRPFLLRKMLQAPVGANLGEIADPGFGSCRVWSLNYPTSNEMLDNSDTMTADSDIDTNEENWSNPQEYYQRVNNEKNLMDQNRYGNLENIQDAHQLPTSVGLSDNYRYQYVHNSKDTQQNCQKWIAKSAFGIREENYLESFTDNSKSLQAFYYNGAQMNNRVSRATNQEFDRYQVTEEATNYKINQNRLDLDTREPQSYFQSQGAVQEESVGIADPYYSSLAMKHIAQNNGEAEYFTHTRPSYDPSVQDTYVPEVEQVSTFPQLESTPNPYEHIQEPPLTFPRPYSDTPTQYDAEIFNQYGSISNNQASPFIAGYEQRNCNNVLQPEPDVQTDSVAVEASQAQLNRALEAYWPRWLPNNSTNSGLENILNFRTTQSCVDYSKIEQTSCVYCYTAPIISQMIAAENSCCSQKKRLVAEHRQHSFLPHFLLYNDAATGLIMPNSKNRREGQDATEKLQNAEIIMLAEKDKIISDNGQTEVEETAKSRNENLINDAWINNYPGYQFSDIRHSGEPYNLNKETSLSDDSGLFITPKLGSICDDEIRKDINF
ncbi:uncharacterized protein LOC105703749 [Orussus abietinus]|uniref:uncharacterized protein LOC105703749 n=1 Tax=Orussus abietinus TaxID=222816 RepID=UPI00062637B0|nr:uncharacterized protein LOC105703749 [Orussus abietinus]